MSYDANSIETLDFVDAVKKRIEMYMGSADNQGVLQCIREVISNSIDEFSIGYGNQIDITVDTEKNKFTCRDYARSIPFGKRADGSEAMVATFMTAHTGGKFSEKQYGNAIIGQNGIGVKGVALSSKQFIARSYRDGKCAELILEDGKLISYTVNKSNEKQGTYIEFIPSQEVYRLEPIHISLEEVCHMCEDWGFLNKGLIINVTDCINNKTYKYYSKNGVADFIKTKITSTIQKEPFIYYVEDSEGNKIEIAFLWGSKKEQSYVFTNGLYNIAGGTSLTGAKTAITRTMNNLAKNKFSGDFIRENLCYVINAKVPHASFSDQTKTKVNTPALKPLADKAFTEGLKLFATTHSDEFDKVLTLLTKINKANIAGEKAREAILASTTQIEKNQKKKVFSSDKLKDAEFLGQNSILLVVEGLSAASSMAVARDPKKYGILAARGKILNCLSHDEERIFQNEEINLLLSAMNIVPGKYNPNKLRYGKIAICSDSDSDGFHIGLLIMAAIYKLAPQFLQEKRLCWLRSPLYIEKKGKIEKYYFTDEEIKNVEISGELQRNKGLGSLTAEQAKNSMFNLENQRLDILEPDDDSLLLLSQLMGEDNSYRKDFIFSNVDFSEIHE